MIHFKRSLVKCLDLSDAQFRPVLPLEGSIILTGQSQKIPIALVPLHSLFAAAAGDPIRGWGAVMDGGPPQENIELVSGMPTS